MGDHVMEAAMLLANRRIVYVEDDPANRKLVEILLKAEGADVHFERWGTPATSVSTVLAHMPVDLILMDLMFPAGFSGYLIYDVLKRQPLLADIPVVLVSAADPSIEMPRAKSMGFAGYIGKPIDALQFAEQLRTIIEEHTPIWFAPV